jgi:hypothetical protein
MLVSDVDYNKTPRRGANKMGQMWVSLAALACPDARQTKGASQSLSDI